MIETRQSGQYYLSCPSITDTSSEDDDSPEQGGSPGVVASTSLSSLETSKINVAKEPNSASMSVNVDKTLSMQVSDEEHDLKIASFDSTLQVENTCHHDTFQEGFQRLFGLCQGLNPDQASSANDKDASEVIKETESPNPDASKTEKANHIGCSEPENHSPTHEDEIGQKGKDGGRRRFKAHREISDCASADDSETHVGQQIQEKLSLDSAAPTESTQSTESTETDHPAKTTKKAFWFEAQYTGLACATLLFYCLAHLTIYELIYALLLELTEPQFANIYLLYFGLMLTGLIILRSTGFLWHFLSSKRYRRTKKELKERRERGDWDVKLMDWLDERPNIRTTLEVIGFYFVYISLGFFWNIFLTCVIDQREAIYEVLPSARYLEQVERRGATINVNTTTEGVCETSTNWEVEDFEFIYETVSKASYYQYSGNIEAPLYSAPTGILLYFCAASLSIYCLSKIGVPFVDNW